MSDSILISTKKALDIPESYDVFDANIIMYINSVFSTLNQLGIGPVAGYEIEDGTPTWTEYLGGNTRLNFVKSYMYLRVRMLFDPPGTSFLLDAIKSQIAELESRISIERETGSTELLGGYQKITGNLGDVHVVQINNPVGQTIIDASGTYTAEFVSGDGTRSSEVLLDTSRKSEGLLFLTVTIADGTYTVVRVDPRRTIMVIDVSVR